MSEIKFVSQSAHPLGGHFAQAVVDAFHPLALAGAHWAWNICYAIKDACAEPGTGQG